MNEIWETRRKALEEDVERAVLELFQHMHGAGAFLMEIRGTTPPVYVVAGDIDAIRRMLPG